MTIHNPFDFKFLVRTLALAAIAALIACGGSSKDAGTMGVVPAGRVNLSITDAPSDQWQEVSVVLNSASLRSASDHTWTQVWLADPANPLAGKVNLVDLNSVADLLSHSASLPAGSYDTVRLVINTDPATMSLVDDNGNVIPASDITVIDPSGAGQINVRVDPAIQVTAGQTTNLQLDFDLAHPLSIVEETFGGARKVILNLQVRLRAMPGRPQDLQFTRKLGQVTAVAPPSFTIKDARGSSFSYGTDTNTMFLDAEAKATGSIAGLAVNKYALVDANLNADGSLYARRVWYATSADLLPVRTPEGLVRRVDPVAHTFSMYTKAVSADGKTTSWKRQTVTVDSNTVWTFHTSVSMGTGTAFLKDIWRGCRVEVQFGTNGTTATQVNVQNAHDSGFISAASATGLTFGWPGMALPATMGVDSAAGHSEDDPSGRLWAYYQNPSDPSNAFSWWFFGLPSSASTVVQDLIDTVAAAQKANLPVSGKANLFWDTQSGGWQAYQLVLAPEKLFASVITQGYSEGPASGSGTLGVSYVSPRDMFMGSSVFRPMPLTLDHAGDLQTVVESITWNQSTRVATFVVPVDPSQWSSLLVPPAPGTYSLARIWVRPVKNGASFDFHAYNVELITIYP